MNCFTIALIRFYLDFKIFPFKILLDCYFLNVFFVFVSTFCNSAKTYFNFRELSKTELFPKVFHDTSQRIIKPKKELVKSKYNINAEVKTKYKQEKSSKKKISQKQEIFRKMLKGVFSTKGRVFICH